MCQFLIKQINEVSNLEEDVHNNDNVQKTNGVRNGDHSVIH